MPVWADTDIQSQVARVNDRLAQAETLHVVAIDRTPGGSNGTTYDCWYHRSGKYRVTWNGGGDAFDGKSRWANTPGFGWHEDFPLYEESKGQWRWIGFESFFDPSVQAWSISGVDGDQIQFKTTESAMSYGILWWSKKTMRPAGYDYWVQNDYEHAIRYTKVEIDSKPPKGCFVPKRG